MNEKKSKKLKVSSGLVEPINKSKLPPDLKAETLAMIELINHGKKDIAAGRFCSVDEAFDELENELENEKMDSERKA